MVTPELPLIVLTGGPSAGKTAVLEMVRRMVGADVAMLPEAAGILFSGGFWRLSSVSARKAAQRAIFHVQRQLEIMAAGERSYRAAVCDRGTLDGLAYWPNSREEFLRDLNIDREKEMLRYRMVVHLRTPVAEAYSNHNPLRIETPEEAQRIDERIERAWEGHPNRIFVENSVNFLEKAEKAMALILAELQACCPGQG